MKVARARKGIEVSISSIRADSLTEELVSSLARGGHRTLTVAPEAGTERLRHVIRKDISDAAALRRLRPGPRPRHPEPQVLLHDRPPDGDGRGHRGHSRTWPRGCSSGCACRRSRGSPFGRLTLSISSFVPKPWTPFQWAAFDPVNRLEAKLRTIKAGVRRLHNVRVLHENPREAFLQALLARGDRRVADFLEEAARREGDWRTALREWGGDADFYTHRERPLGETLAVGPSRRRRAEGGPGAGTPARGAVTGGDPARADRRRRRAMTQPEGSSRVDVQEHGANQQTSTRRLYMQLQAFGDCEDPKRLTGALERARVEGVLYANAADPLGVGVLGIAEDPAFFVGRWRELLGSRAVSGAPAEARVTRCWAARTRSATNPISRTGCCKSRGAPCSTRRTSGGGRSGTRCAAPARSRS